MQCSERRVCKNVNHGSRISEKGSMGFPGCLFRLTALPSHSIISPRSSCPQFDHDPEVAMTVKKARSVKHWPEDERLCKSFIAHGPLRSPMDSFSPSSLKKAKLDAPPWTLPWRSL